jgi:K+ transporter
MGALGVVYVDIGTSPLYAFVKPYTLPGAAKPCANWKCGVV